MIIRILLAQWQVFTAARRVRRARDNHSETLRQARFGTDTSPLYASNDRVKQSALGITYAEEDLASAKRLVAGLRSMRSNRPPVTYQS